MPPRWLTILIVAFWLGTTGWLLYQDVWPLFLPAQAPPYAIDLEDEVLTRQAHIHWTVSYNDRPYLRAETWVEPNPADDTFTLKAELRPLLRKMNAGPESPAPADGKEADDASAPFSGLVEIRHALSEYRVTRQGDLRSVSMDFSATVGGLTAGEGSLQGDVRDGQFRPHVRVSSPVLPSLNFDRDLDPVPVAAHGSVLSPMHPVNRIAGLRPGQTWRLPLVDPVPMVVSALLKKYLGDFAPDAEEMEVTACVLPEKQSWKWNNVPVACYVIEYQDNTAHVIARTWVRADNGLVLRQEAKRGDLRKEAQPGDEIWALQRD